ASSRRRHTRLVSDWSSDVCSSDLRYLDIEHTFDHFYARKVCFVRPAEGFVIFPGGFGTLDELYEALTLIQTGKIKNFPVVLFDKIGRASCREREQMTGDSCA